MSYDSQTSTSLINKLRKDVDSLTLKIATIQDQKATGVSGGASIATTWTPRTLNTLRSDPNGLILDLSSNTFTVASGAYQVKVISPFHSTTGTRLRLWDVTNNVLIGYSVSTYVYNQTNVYLYLDARIQPHKDNVYRLDYYCDTSRADGLGIATNTGDIEIYTVLEVTRLDTGMTKPQGGSGVQGPQGPAGPAGPAGPPGPAGSGTVTSVSVVTANGVSGSVANPTTTPAITLTLGAITPSSVAASGAISAGATVTGSNLSGVNTGDQVIILGGDRMLTEGGDFLITESSDYILETGDVTGSGTGRITTTITPQAVTYDKMQWVSATDRVLGRQSANPGVIEEIVCTAAGRALLDDNSAADQRTTLGAVPVGPITTSGLTVGANNRLLGRVNSAGAVEEISLGTGISVAGSVLSLGAITPTSVAASGTVTGSNLSGTSSGSNTGDQTITLTGPVTGSGMGSFATTITNGAVTYDKIQTAAAIKRLLGSDATGTSIGEINLGANLLMTGNTLASSNPGGTVTSVSVTTANGVSGTVANATTTPAISLALGAITPTSVAASGAVTGSNLSGSNTGDQTITLTGDVTGSGTGTFGTTIANGAVTYAKMQTASNVKRLIGSDASGTGLGEILLGSNLNIVGNILSASTSGGTVTSVNADGSTTGMTFSGGPITGSGTLTLGGTLGVSNGGTGATSAAVARTNLGLAIGTDIPSPSGTGATGTWNIDVLGSAGTITSTVPISKGGTGATSAAAALTNLGAYPASNPNGYTSNAGTVTSVTVSGGTTGLSFSGTPITTSGTATLAGTLAIANGGTGLTSVGTQYQVLTSTGTAATWGSVDLNNGTSNVLPVSKGGTSSITAQSAINTLAGATTSGQYLRGNGTNVVMSAIQGADLPAISLNTGVTGTLGVTNGGTGQSNVYTDGDLLIGKSLGGTLNRAKLTAGTGISITNGSGAITIAATGSGSGDVVGPTGSTNNTFAIFDGTTGKVIKESSWMQKAGDISGPVGYSSMVDGFVYIPSGSTAPSGTPTNVTAPPTNVPLFLQTNNAANTNILWVHNGYAWKSVTLT